MQTSTAQILTITPPSAGREVQDSIRRIEASIDDVLAEGATLIAKSLRANRAAGLASPFTQKALQRQMSLMSAGMQMRELAYTAHQDMRNVLKRVDIDVVGWGDVGPSPKLELDPSDTALA